MGLQKVAANDYHVEIAAFYRFHGGPATFLFSDAVEALRSPIERGNSPTKRDTLHSQVESTRKSSVTSTLQDGPIDLDELYFKPWVSSIGSRKNFSVETELRVMVFRLNSAV